MFHLTVAYYMHLASASAGGLFLKWISVQISANCIFQVTAFGFLDFKE